MMRLKYWIFLLAISGYNNLKAQLTTTTLSGQNLIQAEDGSWEKSTSHSNTTKKSSEYDVQISALLDKAETIERTYFASKYRADMNISKCETALSKIKKKENKDKYAQLTDILKKLKDQQRIETRQYTQSAENVKTVRNISNLKPKKQKAAVEEWAEILNVNVEKEAVNPQIGIGLKENSYQNLKTQKSDCLYATQYGKENKPSIELAALPFFTYTSPQLKQYFKEKELMETQASLVREGKNIFLKLQISIISRDAAKNYGTIPKAGMLRLTFVNGSNVSLFAQEDVRYDIENYTGKAIYSIRYPIQKEDIDALKKTPLDTAGIVWSSGFEMYDIYNVDTIILLFNCLDSIKS
jgi:hypothetical protein